MDERLDKKLEVQKIEEELARAFEILRDFVKRPKGQLILGGGEGYINGARMVLEKAQNYDDIPDIQTYMAELAILERTALKKIVDRFMDEFELYQASPTLIREGIVFHALSLLWDLRACGENVENYKGKMCAASKIMLEIYLRDFAQYTDYKEIPTPKLFMALDILVLLQELGIDIQEYVSKFESVIPKAALQAALQAKWKDHDRVSSIYLALQNPAFQIRRNEKALLLRTLEDQDKN